MLKGIKKKRIKKTHQQLSKYVVKTPLVKGSKLINTILSTNIFFKMEFFQNAGTFKARGAINNVLNLTMIYYFLKQNTN